MQPSTIQSFGMKNENKDISRQTEVNFIPIVYYKRNLFVVKIFLEINNLSVPLDP